jgi:hypothetical protein
MSLSPLSVVRRHTIRRAISLLAAVALLWAGFAQAAHYHRTEHAGTAGTDSQCLLCLHVDRSAPPPEAPKAVGPVLVDGTPVLQAGILLQSREYAGSYDARGPPRA